MRTIQLCEVRHGSDSIIISDSSGCPAISRQNHFGLFFCPYKLEKRKKFGVDHSWFTLKLCWVILNDFPVLLIAKYQLSNQRGNSEKRWKLSHFHTNIFCYCYMMNLSLVPPLGVKIMTEDQPMVSGREYSLKCVSWGSLPPAEISWYRRQSYGAKVTMRFQNYTSIAAPSFYLVEFNVIPVLQISPGLTSWR